MIATKQIRKNEKTTSNYGSISCRFWDIQCRKMSWHWNQGQSSRKVIERGTILYTGYNFLLVFYVYKHFYSSYLALILW